MVAGPATTNALAFRTLHLPSLRGELSLMVIRWRAGRNDNDLDTQDRRGALRPLLALPLLFRFLPVSLWPLRDGAGMGEAVGSVAGAGTGSPATLVLSLP